MSKIMALIQKSVKRFMMKAIKTDGILALIEIGRSVVKVAEFPKITNSELFMAKIYEALVLATDFQIGSGAIIVNDGLVHIPNIVGDYAVKVEFVKNWGT